MSIKVSVIIPCFNLGRFIGEAIDSVTSQTFQDFEIIIINDGSTDSETNEILKSINSPKVKLVTTDNQGLVAARNTGISEALGEYILPLDADDKIASTYLEKAVAVLDQKREIGIVYCEAKFFGAEESKWDLPEFELSRMLIDNLIFCSALFRREDWKTVNGYKSYMTYGWEDYDFWLSIIELERKVYRIPEQLFFYRKRKGSMANLMSEKHLLYSYKQLAKNHRDLYINNIEHIFKYIYSLRAIILNLEQESILKDTKVHEVNLQILDLISENNDLKYQVTNIRVLIRQMLRNIKKKWFSIFGISSYLM